MKRAGLILICVLSFIFLAAALSQAGQPDNYQENLKRWQEMTPEQRERFRREWDERCCWGASEKKDAADKVGNEIFGKEKM